MNTMLKNKLKLMAVPALLVMTVASSLMPAEAHNRYYSSNARYYRNQGSFSQNHPYIQKAAIGGGAGALIGGILGQDGYRADGAIKGAVLGAGAGLGYEYLKRQGTFNNGFRW